MSSYVTTEPGLGPTRPNAELSTWPSVPLADLGAIVTGSTPPTSQEHFFGGDVPFVTPADLDLSDPINVTPRTLSNAGTNAVRLLPKDAVLVCCIGSLGKTGIAGRPLATNQQINAVIFDEKRLCPRYGFHACRRLKQRLEAMAPATTLAIVSKSKFSALEIPVPPMHMQQRIAAILDQADSLRRLRQRAIERLNSLGQAIFSEMFGDLKSNSKSFRMQLLSDLIYVRGGFAFPSSDFGEVGHPVVRISNIDGETVWIDGSARIEENRLGKGKTFGVNEGDILIAMSGATTGKIGVMPSYAGPVYLNQRVGRYEIKLKDRIDPSYLRLLVKSDFYQSKILEQAWGAAQPNVSGAQLASFEAPIPPMEMQEVFANRLRTLELCKTASSNALQRAKILFRSLQHRAFHGEL